MIFLNLSFTEIYTFISLHRKINQKKMRIINVQQKNDVTLQRF